MKFYLSKKQGVFLKITETQIPQLKKQGSILKNLSTDKIICISNEFLEEKFKEINSMTIDKLKK